MKEFSAKLIADVKTVHGEFIKGTSLWVLKILPAFDPEEFAICICKIDTGSNKHGLIIEVETRHIRYN